MRIFKTAAEIFAPVVFQSIAAINTFTLHPKDPWFEMGKRHEASLKEGWLVHELLVLVNVRIRVFHVKCVPNQICRYICCADPLGAEIREQLKVPRSLFL